jgi:DNA-binding NarL/FixJ family response regulator
MSLPKVKLIFLTIHSGLEYVNEAFRAGASGYILKRSVASELLRAIEEVLKGRTYLTPAIAKGLHGRLPGAFAKGRMPSIVLTVRQREVVQLVAEGHSSKEIAAILNLTAKTVEFHKSMIRRKLQLRGTADLIKYAIDHKIVGT